MDLGKKLREALSKLTGKPYVDADDVKALTKDLQRVLISSDVNVKLVLGLSKRIEERALKTEKMESLTLKEHVTKIVYEELVQFMGRSYSPRLDKHKVLMCGLYGSGKCVHKDSVIPLTDGRIKTIEGLYTENRSKGERPVEDGYRIECPANGPELFAFNKETLKIEKRRATALWKLKKRSKLLKVVLDNGNSHSIIVTPEHPFFILENGEVKQLRADRLRADMQVATAISLEFEGGFQRIGNEIINEFGNCTLEDERIASHIAKELLTKFGTLKNAYKKMRPATGYPIFTRNLKYGRVHVEVVRKAHAYGITTSLPEKIRIKGSKSGGRSGSVSAPMTMPTTVDEELAEFLGYVWGDGYIYKSYVEVTNNDPEILSRLDYLSRKLFALEGKIRTDKRNGVKKFIVASVLLVAFINVIFKAPIGKKSKIIEIPELLLKSPKKVIGRFIRAYFDTDGYVEKDSRHIEFCSASRNLIEQLRLVLLRFRIFSNISQKTTNQTQYCRLFLKSDDVVRFGEEISTILPRKRARFDTLSKICGQGQGSHQMIPTGNLLKIIREAHGFSIGEVQKYVSSYGIHERNRIISRNSLVKFLAALGNQHKNWLSLTRKIRNGAAYEDIIEENQGWATASLCRLEHQGYITRSERTCTLTAAGHQVLSGSEEFDIDYLRRLKALASSDVCWIRVNTIEVVDEEDWVYDLTVDDLHTFIANGIIVHNTTTCAKLAHFYKTRGLSVALIAADTDRPAAQEQLEQLAKQVGAAYYTIKGEKDPAAIVKDAMKKIKEEVIIVDSAGRSAFDGHLVEELRAIAGQLKPDETYLVVSADIGQIAGKQATEFNSAVPLSGVIVTKMDGSGKGGGALSSVAASDAKISFVGLGEKPADFEVYDSQKFVGRLLGVPDIGALMEKIKEISKETDVQKLESEELTIDAFYEQLKAAKKLGPLGNVFSMLGAADIPKEMVQQSEGKLKKFESMINSMTKQEKKDASLLKSNPNRIARIAKGSGCTEKEVREFLSQFEKVEKMMNMFKRNRGFRKKMEKMMKGGMPGMGPDMKMA
ncbi:signal recognition particle receptor subunit alpha [Candidatus Micrarchaeota archaeon]|nr:signal recognition particle receptor subunit alpha [Candidatus Micrarchaeota archaeon]